MLNIQYPPPALNLRSCAANASNRGNKLDSIVGDRETPLNKQQNLIIIIIVSRAVYVGYGEMRRTMQIVTYALLPLSTYNAKRVESGQKEENI